APRAIYTLSLHDALPISYHELHCQGDAVAWLSLTPLANGIHRFFIQFVAAIRQTQPDFAPGLPEWLEGLPPRLYQELALRLALEDRKSTRLNSSHVKISY